MPELTPRSYRDLPEWQTAHAEYLIKDDGDPDRRFIQSVRGAAQMLEIESAFAAGLWPLPEGGRDERAAHRQGVTP